MTPNLLADVCLTAARGPHQPAARCRQTVDDKNISALLKISTATRKQFCTDYLPVVSNIGPLTMTQAERQLSLSGLHLLLWPGHELGFVSTSA